MMKRIKDIAIGFFMALILLLSLWFIVFPVDAAVDDGPWDTELYELVWTTNCFGDYVHVSTPENYGNGNLNFWVTCLKNRTEPPTPNLPIATNTPVPPPPTRTPWPTVDPYPPPMPKSPVCDSIWCQVFNK